MRGAVETPQEEIGADTLFSVLSSRNSFALWPRGYLRLCGVRVVGDRAQAAYLAIRLGDSYRNRFGMDI